jgi:hypothetical protein
MGAPPVWADRVQKSGSDVGITLEFSKLHGDVPEERELVLDLAAVLKTSPSRFKVVFMKRSSSESRFQRPTVPPTAMTVMLDRRQTNGSSVAGIGLTLTHNEVSGEFLVHTVHPGSPAAESSMVIHLLTLLTP